MIALELYTFQEKFKKFRGNKKITTNIYRIQANDSIICGYFCIGFNHFMVKGKSFLDYNNLFSSNEFEKNHKVKLEHFQ